MFYIYIGERGGGVGGCLEDGGLVEGDISDCASGEDDLHETEVRSIFIKGL